MARPKNATSHETRIRLLGVARDLFAAQGLDGVSMSEIAKAANVTAPVVNHYFGGKAGLYDACIDTLYASLAAEQRQIAESLQDASSMEQAVERGTRAIFQLARRNQSAIKLLLRHVADTGEIGSARRETTLLPFLEFGASLFAPMTGRSELEVRLTLQSLVFLIGRWAVASQREAAAVSGLSASEAWPAIENHLVTVALTQLSRRHA